MDACFRGHDDSRQPLRAHTIKLGKRGDPKGALLELAQESRRTYVAYRTVEED